jgi:hypothetical protein
VAFDQVQKKTDPLASELTRILNMRLFVNYKEAQR